MSAIELLALKQRISLLSKKELRELSAYMAGIRHEATLRKTTKFRVQRDPVTKLPYFTPPCDTPRLTLTMVKKVLQDFP